MRRIFATLLICTLPAAAQANGCYINEGLGVVLAKAASAQRQSNGLPPVTMDAKLTKAAKAHACDMALKGYFAHQGQTGSTPKTRAKQAGYHACLIAENIAMGERNPRVAFDDWMNSASHRRNILLPGVSAIGTAVVPQKGGKGPWYVMVLAKPCD
ncbi:MAG: CAP domain-containing protein [Rhodobacteraceae bacterium]|nr:CAP domain-containing protein [Paracoccaceae bacterium]